MSLWRSRRRTLCAMAWLVLARLLVRFVTLSRLRIWLGQPATDAPLVPSRAAPSDQASEIAGNVERAAMRLPGESKCLPKAMALHWMLGHVGMPSRLVIAIHRTDRTGQHAYHAWVEQAGYMLIGHCDRSEYREVMAFEQAGAA